MKLLCSLGLVLVALTPGLAHAQTPASAPATLPANTRVRIFAPWLEEHQRIIGALVRSDSTGVAVRSADGKVWTVPLQGVKSIEVSRGRIGPGQAALKGAGMGLLAGVTWGLVASTIGHQSGSTGKNMAIGGGVGLAAGAAMGALLIHERWEKLPEIPRLALVPQWTSHATGVSVALGYDF
jgi:hypothetical protein